MQILPYDYAMNLKWLHFGSKNFRRGTQKCEIR